MRIVIALGGNALLRRGEPMTADNQRGNIRVATEQIAKIHPGNQLVIAHGNGPQIGLLSLQAAAYTSVSPYPLDVLGAETDGMIGYIIEQELGNLLDFEVPFATLLTQVEVDPNDPAFQHPSKPIGPVYSKAEAEKLAAEKGWAIAPDGDKFRRVVASPKPKRIFCTTKAIEYLKPSQVQALELTEPLFAALLLTLGRMCARQGLWGKAAQYLERSLALVPSSGAWESLGDVHAGQGDAALAQRCYRNALALARGEAVEPLPQGARSTRLDTRPIAVEERSEHGVPRLPE